MKYINICRGENEGFGTGVGLVSGERAENGLLSPEPSVRVAATRPLLLHKETSVEATMIYTAWPHSRCPTYFDLWLECYSNTNLKEDEIQQRAFVGLAPRYSPFRCLCPCGERRGGGREREWKEDLASKLGRKAPPWSPVLLHHCPWIWSRFKFWYQRAELEQCMF